VIIKYPEYTFNVFCCYSSPSQKVVFKSSRWLTVYHWLSLLFGWALICGMVAVLTQTGSSLPVIILYIKIRSCLHSLKISLQEVFDSESMKLPYLLLYRYLASNQELLTFQFLTYWGPCESLNIINNLC